MKRDISYVIKRVIIGLLLFLLISMLKSCRVNAKSNPISWDYYDFTAIPELYMRNWATYPSSYTDLTNNQISVYGENISYGSTDLTYSYFFTNNQYSVYNQGFSIGYYPNTRLKAGYLYSIETLLCMFDGGSLNNLNPYSSAGGTVGIAFTNTPTYQVSGKIMTTSITINEVDVTTGSCAIINSLIVPSNDGGWYAVRLTSSSLITGNIAVFGTKVAELGIYSTTIQSIIENSIGNSGVATGTQIQNLSSQLTSMQSSINNNITSSTNSINNNIDDMEQSITAEQEITNEKLDDINDSINDDNVSGANSEVDDLLDNESFEDTSGIQSIITLPLNFIQSISSKTCRPILLNIPFMNEVFTIPCIKPILQEHLPSYIFTLIELVINGIIVYRILIDIVSIVKSAREPDEDRLEVLEL